MLKEKLYKGIINIKTAKDMILSLGFNKNRMYGHLVSTVDIVNEVLPLIRKELGLTEDTQCTVCTASGWEKPKTYGYFALLGLISFTFGLKRIVDGNDEYSRQRITLYPENIAESWGYTIDGTIYGIVSTLAHEMRHFKQFLDNPEDWISDAKEEKEIFSTKEVSKDYYKKYRNLQIEKEAFEFGEQFAYKYRDIIKKLCKQEKERLL